MLPRQRELSAGAAGACGASVRGHHAHPHSGHHSLQQSRHTGAQQVSPSVLVYRAHRSQTVCLFVRKLFKRS